jgi:hypothetical protein
MANRFKEISQSLQSGKLSRWDFIKLGIGSAIGGGLTYVAYEAGLFGDGGVIALDKRAEVQSQAVEMAKQGQWLEGLTKQEIAGFKGSYDQMDDQETDRVIQTYRDWKNSFTDKIIEVEQHWREISAAGNVEEEVVKAMVDNAWQQFRQLLLAEDLVENRVEGEKEAALRLHYMRARAGMSRLEREITQQEPENRNWNEVALLWQQINGEAPMSSAGFILPDKTGQEAQIDGALENLIQLIQTIQPEAEGGQEICYFNIKKYLENQHDINHIQFTILNNKQIAMVGHAATQDNGQWGWAPKVVIFDQNGAEVKNVQIHRRPQDFNAFDATVERVMIGGVEHLAVSYCVRSEDYSNSQVLVKYIRASDGVITKEQILDTGAPGEFLDYTTSGFGNTHYAVFKPDNSTELRWAVFDENKGEYVLKKRVNGQPLLLNANPADGSNHNDQAVQFPQTVYRETVGNKEIDTLGYAKFAGGEFRILQRDHQTGSLETAPITVLDWETDTETFLDINKLGLTQPRIATIAVAARHQNNQGVDYAAAGAVYHKARARGEIKVQITDAPDPIYIGESGYHYIRPDIKYNNHGQIVVNCLRFTHPSLAQQITIVIHKTESGYQVVTQVHPKVYNLNQSYNGDFNELNRRYNLDYELNGDNEVVEMTQRFAGGVGLGNVGQEGHVQCFVGKYQICLPAIFKNWKSN